MNKYYAQYRGKVISVEAETSYEAQKKAQEVFRCKKGWEIGIVLYELFGKTYEHSTATI